MAHMTDVDDDQLALAHASSSVCVVAVISKLAKFSPVTVTDAPPH